MTDEMRDDGHLPATKADMRGIASRLDGHDDRLSSHDGNLRRLNISFARLEGDMAEVKVKVGAIGDDFAYFKSFLERMNANIEAALRKTDLQGSMLMDHEGRLKKLESRPS